MYELPKASKWNIVTTTTTLRFPGHRCVTVFVSGNRQVGENCDYLPCKFYHNYTTTGSWKCELSFANGCFLFKTPSLFWVSYIIHISYISQLVLRHPVNHIPRLPNTLVVRMVGMDPQKSYQTSNLMRSYTWETFGISTSRSVFPGQGTLIVNHLKSIQRLPRSSHLEASHGSNYTQKTNIWNPKMEPSKESYFQVLRVSGFFGWRDTRNKTWWHERLQRATKKQMLHFLGDEGGAMTGK